ncbi:MAG: hypothetical protein NTU62_04060 [Spirochaetes bacterium]|nr:hypothetical protein [Spirochaetota bacterium]
MLLVCDLTHIDARRSSDAGCDVLFEDPHDLGEELVTSEGDPLAALPLLEGSDDFFRDPEDDLLEPDRLVELLPVLRYELPGRPSQRAFP